MLIPFQDRRASGRSGRPEDTGAVQLSHVTHTGAPGGWEDAFQKGTHKEQKYEQRHERRPPGPQCATAAGERLQRGNSPRMSVMEVSVVIFFFLPPIFFSTKYAILRWGRLYLELVAFRDPFLLLSAGWPPSPAADLVSFCLSRVHSGSKPGCVVQKKRVAFMSSLVGVFH